METSQGNEIISVDSKKALEILEAIPTEKFVHGDFKREEGGVTKGCALGHIHMHFGSEDGWGDYNGYGIRQASSLFLKKRYGLVASIAYVNNSDNVNGYTEPEIKDRVIHLLKDMVEAGY